MSADNPIPESSSTKGNEGTATHNPVPLNQEPGTSPSTVEKTDGDPFFLLLGRAAAKWGLGAAVLILFGYLTFTQVVPMVREWMKTRPVASPETDAPTVVIGPQAKNVSGDAKVD